MEIEKVEHVESDGKRFIRIVYHNPLSALAMHSGRWDISFTDWMTAEMAAELVGGIVKALRTKPIVKNKKKAAKKVSRKKSS